MISLNLKLSQKSLPFKGPFQKPDAFPLESSKWNPHKVVDASGKAQRFSPTPKGSTFVNQNLRTKRLKKQKKLLRPSFIYRTYLTERQKLSRIYGHLPKKSLLSYCQEATKYPGSVNNNVLLLLERRLDVVLYRLRFCSSIAQARRLMRHHQVFINTKVITTPSFQLKPGDVLSLKPNSSRTFGPFFPKKQKPKRKSLENRKQTLLRLLKKKEAKKKGFSFFRQNQLKKQRTRTRSFTKRKYFILNFEVSFIMRKAIYLYAPQKLSFPTFLNINAVRRSFGQSL